MKTYECLVEKGDEDWEITVEAPEPVMAKAVAELCVREGDTEVDVLSVWDEIIDLPPYDKINVDDKEEEKKLDDLIKSCKAHDLHQIRWPDSEDPIKIEVVRCEEKAQEMIDE